MLLAQINVKSSWKTCEKPTFACGNTGMLSQDQTIEVKILINELFA